MERNNNRLNSILPGLVRAPEILPNLVDMIFLDPFRTRADSIQAEVNTYLSLESLFGLSGKSLLIDVVFLGLKNSFCTYSFKAIYFSGRTVQQQLIPRVIIFFLLRAILISSKTKL